MDHRMTRTGYPPSGSYRAERGICPCLLAAESRFCTLTPYCPLPDGLLHAGRAEQISAKVRMAYRPVADDIDERGLAGPQCTFEGRAKILRPLDVLTVTIHELEHPVVALVR